MTEYLIFGNGFIGNNFNDYLKDTIISKVRIKDVNDICVEIEKHNPQVVINCIGKTGIPNVDWCESHKEETFFSNVTVSTYIAEVCENIGLYMVHMGSGCIYEGDASYTEDSNPNFKGSFYSKTKIYSEQILKQYNNVLQIRIRMPVDNKPSPRNLITKLVGYSKVINTPNSVTCIPDMLGAASRLMRMRKTGIYNAVQAGFITHKELLEIYHDIVDINFKMPIFIPIEELDTITVAKRSNCTLSTTKLERAGTKMRSVKEAIAACMEEYKKWINQTF